MSSSGRNLRRALSHLKADDEGNIAIVSALVLPLVIGGAGLSVETSYWYFKDLELQGAADSAAFAAGIERRAGADKQTAESAALLAATENGFDPALGDMSVNLPPVSGAFAGQADAVEVHLNAQAERFFSAIFSDKPVALTARAVARFTRAQDACVLALNRTASTAANFAGSAKATFSGCTVMSNSSAGDAINVQGAAELTTDCLVSVGGVSLTTRVSLTDCPGAVTEAPLVGDPFADVPEPQRPLGCKSAPNNPKTPYTLTPGRYCGGLDIKGEGSLDPGVYYLEGDFNMASNATLKGKDVTIYLSGSSTVTINGTATVDLQAPTSGTYAGMLFFGDRDTTSTNTSRFNGTADSKLTGAIYMPSQAIEYLGNFSGINGCTQVVADTVKWSGNTTVQVDCESLGLRTIPAYTIVRLFE